MELLCLNVLMSRRQRLRGAKSLRRQIGREEFDYSALMAALSGFAKPHDKITRLLQSGEIIRVKKGLYVFGKDQRFRPYSRELLANLIYGPSFVSLDYALSFHGLIPESVKQVTSVTSGRARWFETPVGIFVYRPVPLHSFHVGVQRIENDDVAFLIASAERAVADKVREDRTVPIRSIRDARAYLFDHLRVDEAAFAALNLESLQKAAHALRSRKAEMCVHLLRKLGEAGARTK